MFALLKYTFGKNPIKVSKKYADFANVFFSDLAMELLKNTYINKYAIELKDNK